MGEREKEIVRERSVRKKENEIVREKEREERKKEEKDR